MDEKKKVVKTESTEANNVPRFRPRKNLQQNFRTFKDKKGRIVKRKHEPMLMSRSSQRFAMLMMAAKKKKKTPPSPTTCAKAKFEKKIVKEAEPRVNGDSEGIRSDEVIHTPATVSVKTHGQLPESVKNEIEVGPKSCTVSPKLIGHEIIHNASKLSGKDRCLNKSEITFKMSDDDSVKAASANISENLSPDEAAEAIEEHKNIVEFVKVVKQVQPDVIETILGTSTQGEKVAQTFDADKDDEAIAGTMHLANHDKMTCSNQIDFRETIEKCSVEADIIAGIIDEILMNIINRREENIKCIEQIDPIGVENLEQTKEDETVLRMNQHFVQISEDSREMSKETIEQQPSSMVTSDKLDHAEAIKITSEEKNEMIDIIHQQECEVNQAAEQGDVIESIFNEEKGPSTIAASKEDKTNTTTAVFIKQSSDVSHVVPTKDPADVPDSDFNKDDIEETTEMIGKFIEETTEDTRNGKTAASMSQNSFDEKGIAKMNEKDSTEVCTYEAAAVIPLTLAITDLKDNATMNRAGSGGNEAVTVNEKATREKETAEMNDKAAGNDEKHETLAKDITGRKNDADIYLSEDLEAVLKSSIKDDVKLRCRVTKSDDEILRLENQIKSNIAKLFISEDNVEEMDANHVETVEDQNEETNVVEDVNVVGECHEVADEVEVEQGNGDNIEDHVISGNITIDQADARKAKVDSVAKSASAGKAIFDENANENDSTKKTKMPSGSEKTAIENRKRKADLKEVDSESKETIERGALMALHLRQELEKMKDVNEAEIRKKRKSGSKLWSEKIQESTPSRATRSSHRLANLKEEEVTKSQVNSTKENESDQRALAKASSTRTTRSNQIPATKITEKLEMTKVSDKDKVSSAFQLGVKVVLEPLKLPSGILDFTVSDKTNASGIQNVKQTLNFDDDAETPERKTRKSLKKVCRSNQTLGPSSKSETMVACIEATAANKQTEGPEPTFEECTPLKSQSRSKIQSGDESNKFQVVKDSSVQKVTRSSRKITEKAAQTDKKRVKPETAEFIPLSLTRSRRKASENRVCLGPKSSDPNPRGVICTPIQGHRSTRTSETVELLNIGSAKKPKEDFEKRSMSIQLRSTRSKRKLDQVLSRSEKKRTKEPEPETIELRSTPFKSSRSRSKTQNDCIATTIKSSTKKFSSSDCPLTPAASESTSRCRTLRSSATPSVKAIHVDTPRPTRASMKRRGMAEENSPEIKSAEEDEHQNISPPKRRRPNTSKSDDIFLQVKNEISSKDGLPSAVTRFELRSRTAKK